MVKKIDYHKIEEALDEGLRQISIRNLLTIADLEAALGTSNIKIKDLTPSQKKAILTSVVKNLEVDLLILKKKDPHIFEKLDLNRVEMRDYFKHPGELSLDQLENIKKIRKKVDIYKRDLKAQRANLKDEEIVKSERKKQKTRRHNTNETWVPLH